jgi:nitroreductase
MEIIEAINSRTSIRAYKKEPVSKELIATVLKTACRAPSAVNYQPWEFYVLAGDALKKLAQANIDAWEAKEVPSPEFNRDMDGSGLPAEMVARRTAVFTTIFAQLGIKRDDKAKRAEWSKKGVSFFDAPAAIIVTMDKVLASRFYLDIGLVTHSIALVAMHYGLGTCIQGQSLHYTDRVYQATGIPESKRLVVCITLGYPDWSHPANKIRTDRVPIEKNTTWLGF